MTTLELATDTLRVPDAPALPGLTFRHFRGESDFPAAESDRAAAESALPAGERLAS